MLVGQVEYWPSGRILVGLVDFETFQPETQFSSMRVLIGVEDHQCHIG